MNLQGKEIQTARLRMIPLTLDHVDAILEWANDPAVTGNSLFFRQPSDRKRIARFILEHEDDSQSAYFAAFVRPEAAEHQLGYVGNVFLFKIDRDHSHCQAGITLKQAAWNQGFAQELLPAICRFAFEDLDMQKVYLQVFTTNTKAVHLYEKVGFKRDGLLRAHYWVNDRFNDMFVMSILRDEFLNQQG